MHSHRSAFHARRGIVIVLVVATTLVASVDLAAGGGAPAPRAADRALDHALRRFVHSKEGPPAAVAVVQRGDGEAVLHDAGVADVDTEAAPTIDDHMRLASVAKAFSGATALSAVADGTLSLTDTLGARVPGTPATWADVTLAQLLQHTSGLPDFSDSTEFREALQASPFAAPPPADLLSFVADEPLLFEPGTKYRYSNSDNVAAALMVAAASGRSYEQELQDRVLTPLDLTSTSLPADALLPEPTIRGYSVSGKDEVDVSELFAAGWSWASGGVVSSPGDANRFIRGYASGATASPEVKQDQFDFVAGHSEPPGPGKNTAGLAIFRYKTRCGTVYGHTGNTAGYTQFVAATADGTRSATVGISSQVTPKGDKARFAELRGIFELAVCAALA